MNQTSSFILSGPDPYVETPRKSLGFQLFNSLKKRDSNEAVNVDAVSGEILTSGEILDKSVKIATIFKGFGLQEGDVICIISENNLNYFIPIVAAFYVGVTVSPLNADYTLGELKHAISLTHPKIILCSKSAIQKALMLKEEYDYISDVIFMINEEHDNYKHIKSLNSCVEVCSASVKKFQPTDIDCSETGAFVYMSSGTTGLPKGVYLTHANFTETLQYFSDPRYAVLQPGDCILLPVPFFHFFGAAIQLTAFINSVKTILVHKFKPDVFLSAIQEFKPTKIFLVPPILLFLTRSPLVYNYSTASLKECFCGGAPLPKTLITESAQRFPLLKVRQLYGLTEISGAATIQLPTNKDGSIGILAPRIFAKVRDPETCKILGPMETGELCFKGPMVMKGYIGDPISTQSTFDEDGFFCSGDAGCYDSNGCFYLQDRLKELIKYKGFQVAPSELETLILRHSAVKDCAVIGIPDERAGELPLAFVVKRNNSDVTEKEIVDYVSEHISAQKRLYGGVRFIDEIPKTPSGKIKRALLKKLFDSC